MTFKKKVTASTLAVSLMSASLAGIPFSDEWLAGKLTVSAAAAAASSSNLDTVKIKLDRLIKQLSAGDKEKLKALRAEITAKITEDVFKASFKDILAKTTAAGVDEDTLYSLFQEVSTLFYDPSYQKLTEIRNNADYIAAAKKLGEAGGVNDLSVDDLALFLFGPGGVETTLVKLVKTKKLSELLALFNSADARNELLREAFRQTLNNTGVGGVKLSVALGNLGITEAQIASAVTSVQGKLDADIVKNATLSLALAYIKAEGIDLPSEGGNPGGGTGGGGGGGAPGGAGGDTGGGSAPTTPNQSLETLLLVDTAKLVKVADGKAVLELKEADMLKRLEAIKTAAAGKTGLTMTLDLGQVKAEAITVPVAKAVVEAAKTAGVETLDVKVNGLKISLPLAQFADALNLTIRTLPDTTVTSIRPLELASDVYELGLEVGGAKVTSFRSPVTVHFPLREGVKVDRELLSVAKVADGQLQFEGGALNGQTMVEPRDSFSAYAVVENKVSFNDIEGVQAWAGRQIAVVAAKGAVEGRSEGLFVPEAPVTRAEFAKMLVRALNLENGSATEAFGDVDSGDWFAPYVAAAAQKGIIQGRSADTFAPSDRITRAEMATMIARALKAAHQLGDVQNESAVLGQFSDAAQIAAALRQGVAFAASHKLVIGNDGKFNPNDDATRAEAAVIVYRTLNFKSE